jgi:hypothetical protein
MTRPALALLISASLLATAAFAQPAPDAAPAAAQLPPPADAQPPQPHGKVVDSVTVTGRPGPTKECSPRDKACVAMVVAELKALYPKELQKWCDHVEERAMMNTMMFMEIDPDRPHPNVGPYMPPAVTKTACARDKTH